jgi:hypothetical protein
VGGKEAATLSPPYRLDSTVARTLISVHCLANELSAGAIVMHHEHTPHHRLLERSKSGPHVTEKEHVGFNGWLAMLITNAVGTMWCAYVFAALALVSLPAAIQGGTAPLVAWLAQTFLQLVLLSVIMVGQKVAAQASDKQALQTYRDAEAILEMQDDVHKLIKINNALTEEIHTMVHKGEASASS